MVMLRMRCKIVAKVAAVMAKKKDGDLFCSLLFSCFRDRELIRQIFGRWISQAGPVQITHC